MRDVYLIKEKVLKWATIVVVIDLGPGLVSKSTYGFGKKLQGTARVEEVATPRDRTVCDSLSFPLRLVFAPRRVIFRNVTVDVDRIFREGS